MAFGSYRNSLWLAQDRAVQEPMRELETDFEMLAGRLAGLIELYVDDPALAPQVRRLRAARDGARRGVEILQQYRQSRSLAEQMPSPRASAKAQRH